jgi:hypothetical protein
MLPTKNGVKFHPLGTVPERKKARRRTLLHKSAATRNAPYPRQNSGGAFKTWASKSGHAVENADANLGFCFLVFEVARL